MSVTVENQYYMRFNVDGNSDFIDKDNFVKFTVQEYCGNLLPTFQLVFRTQDERVIRKLNEGNKIQAQLGRNSSDKLQDVELSVSSLKTEKDGSDFVAFQLDGFCGPLEYVTAHEMSISDKKSGIAVVLDKANENGFTVDTNVTTSTDSQNWIQPNISDKSFVNDCYLRSVVPNNSAVAVALTADKKFIVRDIKKLVDSRPGGIGKYDWKLTNKPLTPKDLSYDADPKIESQAGFINNWLGYGRTIKQIDNLQGEILDILEQPEPLFVSRLDKLSSIEDRYGGSRFLTDSVHPDFHAAFNHNLIFLANLSKIEVAVSVSQFYFNVRPLQIVMFTEESTDSDNASSDTKSGLYLVAGVSRTFQASSIATTLLLNREAFDKVSGG